MALHDLTEQFIAMQSKIDLGRRTAVAQAAHLEVRDLLRGDAALLSHGLEDALIGSYARDTGIWPGKDVDIFGKLTGESIDTIEPAAAYQLFWTALEVRYRDRMTPQPRSIKISFGTGQQAPSSRFLEARAASVEDVFEFSVDVVAAARWGDRWGIPQHDRELWVRTAARDRWTETDPEALNTLTTIRNSEPLVAGQGAFVPTVKAIKQIRRHHLGDVRPGGLFYEFLLHEGFASHRIDGESWADVTASALAYIASRLATASVSPVCDPVLERPYEPAPDPVALATSLTAMQRQALNADGALRADKCPAAAAWRTVFGNNGNGSEPVFPLPAGCREDGTAMIAAAAVNPLRGSDEARGFGDS